MQRTIFEGGAEGELPESLHGEEPVDITWHENVGMFVLAALITLLGVLPFIFFDMMSGWSSTLVENVLLAALNGMGGGP